MLAAFVLLALQVPDATPSGADMLEAFRAACGHVDDFERMRADAGRSGWEEIAASADPRLERLNRLGRDGAGSSDVALTNFRRTAGGRSLFLIVSRFEDGDGVWANGCRLFEFDAAAALDPAALERWMGRPPTGVEDLGAVGARRLWEPGWRDGVTVEASFVPAAGPLRERAGFSGNVLVAQAIGGF